jgi:hypothetical protein
VDPDHEPDLYKISEEHPVPEKGSNPDDILLPSTLIGGPKARMNVVGEQTSIPHSMSGMQMRYGFPKASSETPPNNVSHHQNHAQFSVATTNRNDVNLPITSISHPATKTMFQQCLETQVPQTSNHMNPSQMFQHSSTMTPSNTNGMSLISSFPLPSNANPFTNSQQLSAVHQALSSFAAHEYFLNQADKQRAAAAVAAIGNDPTSQFAAGFAAAAALTNSNFQFAFSQALAMSSSQGANGLYLPNNVTSPASQTEKKKEEEGVTAGNESQK